MSFTSDEPHVSSLDESQVAGYRRVSIAAIAALLLGMLSALALAQPLLLAVPVVAIVVALVSLRAINMPDSNLTGRAFALAGLALALVFAVWAPSRLITRQWHLYEQAREFGDQWLELVRAGKLHAAHQLTLHDVERQPPESSLTAFYEKSTEAQNMFERFRNEKPLKTLADLGDQVTYEFNGGAGLEKDVTGEGVLLAYIAKWDEDGKPRTLNLRLVLERQQVMSSKVYLWRVVKILDPNRVP